MVEPIRITHERHGANMTSLGKLKILKQVNVARRVGLGLFPIHTAKLLLPSSTRSRGTLWAKAADKQRQLFSLSTRKSRPLRKRGRILVG